MGIVERELVLGASLLLDKESSHVSKTIGSSQDMIVQAFIILLEPISQQSQMALLQHCSQLLVK
jgi:hypothetical protein